MGIIYEKRTGQAWKHRNDHGRKAAAGKKRNGRQRRAGFVPQWTLEQLWVSPLRQQWRYVTDGRRMWKEWVPIATETAPQQQGGGAAAAQTAAGKAQPDPLLTSQTRRLTGVKIFDEWVTYLSHGCSDMANFCKRYDGLRTGDLDALAFVLTGMGSLEFQMKYRLRTLEALLRYSDLPPEDVAMRSGFGSKNNLYLTCKREWGMAPMERRAAIQQPGDAGRYR